jgi:MFS transporter, DHA3 family, macrolide efflux protein
MTDPKPFSTLPKKWAARFFLPILVTRHFNGGAIQLVWMNSAFGVGLTVGGLVLGAWGGFNRRILTSMVGLLGLTVGAVAIGVMPGSAFFPAVGAMFVIGLSNPIVNGPLLLVHPGCHELRRRLH